MAGYFKKSSMEHRADLIPKIERLQALTKRANDLKSRGKFAEAWALDPEIKRLKSELGIKPKARKMTPAQRDQKKKELKARVKKCR